MTNAAANYSDTGFDLSERDFAVIAAIFHRETGVHMPPTKRALVQSRLIKRLRALKIDSLKDYAKMISEGDLRQELPFLISSLTTNITKFFREPHHFEDLKKNVLPGLVQSARAGRAVRIWSAGCSNGEEAYSIAFTVLDACPEAGDLDIRILATDIDEAALARAGKGCYAPADLKSVPAAAKARYFSRSGKGEDASWEVNATVRRLVSFRTLNLIGDWPFRRAFDVIMCRNVAIYFDEQTRNRLWQRFATVQRRAGDRLYIGHSERITGPAAACYRSAGCATGYLRTSQSASEVTQPDPEHEPGRPV